MVRQLGDCCIFVLGILGGISATIFWQRASEKAWEVPSIKVKLKYENPVPSARLWGVLPAPRVMTKQFRKHMETLCDDVFVKVDHDDSGRLNSAELHIAVLLIYGQVNHVLGLSLKPPDSDEVKTMLREADCNNDGQLSRSEFKTVFMNRFSHRIIALASARLLTQRLVVPASAVALLALMERQGVEEAVEVLAARLASGAAIGFEQRDRRAAEQVAAAAVKRVAPMASLHVAGASVRILCVEQLVARVLGSGRRPVAADASGN